MEKKAPDHPAASARADASALWRARWAAGQIGFHEVRPDGRPNAILERYATAFLEGRHRVLVPLAGKSRDMRWLAERGLEVVGCELVEDAARAFFAEAGVTPTETRRGAFQVLEAGVGPGRVIALVGDALDLTAEVTGRMDAVFDRAALVALPPALRAPYVAAIKRLVASGARSLVVSLEHDAGVGPPYSVEQAEIDALYGTFADVELLERRDIADESSHILAKGATRVHEIAYLARTGEVLRVEAPAVSPRANDPLHGVTLEMILVRLVERLGWVEMGRRVDIRCFNLDPSVASSLKFLRRTPWARKKVEALYLETS